MEKLLFVCGFPGGGTDLTKTTLNAHPDICINGEMPFLKNIASQGYDRSTTFTNIAEIIAFQNVLKKFDTWNNIENINHDFRPELETKGQLILEEVVRVCFSRNKCRIWGNKTPQNTENIGPLIDLFPNAHFLIVTRDVRDVCLSWRNKWGKDMIWCAAKWSERMNRGWHTTQNIRPERYLYVKHEDILSDTETCCKRMCAFLGMPFSERMLEHHKYTCRMIDGKINYGQEIKRGNKNKWKDQLPYKTVKKIEETAFHTMNVLGYKVEYASAEKTISLWETLNGRWNDFWALLLVGNRSSHQNTVDQRFKSLVVEVRKRLLR